MKGHMSSGSQASKILYPPWSNVPPEYTASPAYIHSGGFRSPASDHRVSIILRESFRVASSMALQQGIRSWEIIRRILSSFVMVSTPSPSRRGWEIPGDRGSNAFVKAWAIFVPRRRGEVGKEMNNGFLSPAHCAYISNNRPIGRVSGPTKSYVTPLVLRFSKQ